jgi:aspartate kinase
VNRICGFGEKLLRVFAGYGIACEHCLSGIHKMSVVLKTPIFDLRRNDILNDIKRVVEADSVRVEGNLSLIAVIGKGMGTVKGTFAKAFNALADSGINVKMIDHGSDDLNIIIGVHDDDFEESIKALYQAMIVKG